MTKRDYQMFWDCAYCGTKELLGVSHRHCPNCGGAQDETRRYFPPAGKEVELKNHKYYGVDWNCQHCSTPNSKQSHNCVNCGSPQDGAFEVDLVDRPKLEKKKISLSTSKVKEYISTKEENDSNSVDSPTRKYFKEDQKDKKDDGDTTLKMVILIMSLVFACVIGFFIYGHFKVTEHQVVVAQKSWERSIDVQEYRSVSDTDWCSSMPSDAYNVSRFREIRSHRQVADGQTCSTSRRDRGDGSYTTERVCHTKYRSEPVYDYRCHYKVNRWRFSNAVLASGKGYSKPKDPDVSHIKVNPQNKLGNLRLGSKSESYKVHFTYLYDKKMKEETCRYNQTHWESFTLKREYVGKVRMIGGLICDEVSTSLRSNVEVK